MTGKTHMAVGVGTASVLLPSNDIKTIIAGTTLALIGSLIVDIDTEKSEGSVLLKEVLFGMVIIAALGAILKEQYKINILSFITGSKTITEMLPALLILAVVLILGKMSSHRSFMHSILGVISFTIPVYMLLGSATLYKWFFVGYVAHILADMLNKKEVKILYPIKKGICFDLCKANGKVDKALFVVFVSIAIIKFSIDLITIGA